MCFFASAEQMLQSCPQWMLGIYEIHLLMDCGERQTPQMCKYVSAMNY